MRWDLLFGIVAGSQRRVITDRTPMRHGEHGLENAEHRVFAVQDGASRTVVAGNGTRWLKAGRVEINHAHGGFGRRSNAARVGVNIGEELVYRIGPFPEEQEICAFAGQLRYSRRNRAWPGPGGDRGLRRSETARPHALL